MKVSFANKGEKFDFMDDYCKGRYITINYSKTQDELVSIEFVTEEKKFLFIKSEEYYLELRYKKFLNKEDVEVKRIYIESHEKKNALRVNEILKKKLALIEEEKTKQQERRERERQRKIDEQKARIEWLKSISDEGVVCFDVETTGLNPERDEILKISIINGSGETLFDEYIKPTHRRTWKEAEEKNGITPAMVKDKKHIEAYLDQLNDIFSSAKVLVGYNIENFDLDFLKEAEITIPSDAKIYDVMIKFAPIYGDWSDRFGEYKYKKLTTCARYYGYGRFKSHDSLEDAKATLHCFKKMMEDPTASF